MSSNAFSGVGTTFGRTENQSTSSASYETIAEINSYSGPNKTRTMIDVTSLDSTDGYKEFITSFRDGGEVALEMNFTPTGYALMNDDFEVEDSRDYRITLPNTPTTEFEFTAYVSALGMAIPLEDKVTASVTLKITGPILTNQS